MFEKKMIFIKTKITIECIKKNKELDIEINEPSERLMKTMEECDK